jgi:integrase
LPGDASVIPLCTWNVDSTKILLRSELTAVLADLAKRSQYSARVRMDRTIFRLACCCGLRVSETAQLRLGDVQLDSLRPHIRIRAAIAKCDRSRRVPLWWDAGTLEDLTAWKAERERAGVSSDDLLIRSRRGAMSRHTLRRRFQRACHALGARRQRTLTIHHGRHTFISHALAGGRTLPEVRDAAGHSSVLVTSVYLHVAIDDDSRVGRLFGCI